MCTPTAPRRKAWTAQVTYEHSGTQYTISVIVSFHVVEMATQVKPKCDARQLWELYRKVGKEAGGSLNPPLANGHAY